jgi:hypothetical protein
MMSAVAAMGADRGQAMPAPGRGHRGRAVLARAGLLAILLVGLVVSVPSGFGLVWFIPYGGVGTLLAVRRPAMSIGWLLLAIGWSLVIATMSLDVTVQEYTDGTLGPVNAVLSVLSASAGTSGFFLFALLAIVFPSGRLPTGRSGLAARVVLAAGVAVVVSTMAMPVISVSVWSEPVGQPVPNPAAILPDLALWEVLTPDTAALLLVILMAASVVSLLVRYRRARGIERQQLKWLASSLLFAVVAVVSGFLLGLASPDLADTGLIWLGAIVAFPLIPVAIGIAVLRYRLYEIDRIVSRTVGWLVVTAALGVVFVALVVGLQALLALVTGGDALAVAASTLVAASLFQPLRHRVQRAVDRRFNRSRYDAERIVAGLAGRLRDEVGLADIGRDVRTAVDRAVRPATVSVWLRGPAGSVASVAAIDERSPERTRGR